MFRSLLYPLSFVVLKNSRYDQTLIRIMVVVAYLGWAAYGSAMILFPDRSPSFSTPISGAALVALGTSWTLFAIQRYPLTFYIYVIFPCYFWREALVMSSGPLLRLYRSGKSQGSMKVLLRAVFVIVALQSMVVRFSIFAYTERDEQPSADFHE